MWENLKDNQQPVAETMQENPLAPKGIFPQIGFGKIICPSKDEMHSTNSFL